MSYLVRREWWCFVANWRHFEVTPIGASQTVPCWRFEFELVDRAVLARGAVVVGGAKHLNYQRKSNAISVREFSGPTGAGALESR